MLKGTLATTLRQTRKKKGWTQEQVAEKCGISDRNFRSIEHGNSNVKIDTMEKLCQGIGLAVILQEIDTDAV